MACDTKLRQRQTAQERASEVRRAVDELARLVSGRQVIPVVGPQGSITFKGWSEQDRSGITDACAYRRLLVQGPPLALAEIARAEMLAGRTVDRRAVNSGVHSHNGGLTWGRH